MVPVEAGFIILFILAAVNGANDVGKSIAGIVETKESESNPHPFRKPIILGGLFSGLGSLGAIVVSRTLFLIFTQGLISTASPLNSSFAIAVLAGATTLVVVGTLLHIPVSSTHAIVGGMVFELAYQYGVAGIEWTTLFLRVLFPMAASPLAALFLSFILVKLSRKPRISPNQGSPRIGLIHWLTAAATSFARGLNDAPKIAALGFLLLPVVLQSTLSVPFGIGAVVWIPYVVVGASMVVGSIAWGHFVTRTIVKMQGEVDSDKRLKAGITTAALVSAGAILGAPVSTTHVAAAAEAGARADETEFFWTTTGGIILGWIVTFPLAGIVALAVSVFLLH